MTNVLQISENYKRLDVLNERYEKLIALNQTHHYTIMVLEGGKLIDNPKTDQYLKLLTQIYVEKGGIWMFNRKYNKIYKDNLKTATSNLATITKKQLFHLTSPI